MIRCPYCRRPQLCREWLGRDGEVERWIIDHPCTAFASPADLGPVPTDTTFIREARNSRAGLKSYRTWKP